ncbi:MAG: hypothetical protein A2171_01765 [Candidatus Levybacteria bacterium RBG_13_35_9]|nr:MAG: hypothetical protein A2171_01765 [Candidatus Levybacteria bacterium RBG_13_35_9]
MKKIIFFDIDQTLFNPDSFLDEFYERLIHKYGLDAGQKAKLIKFYASSKPKDYFDPQIFLKSISKYFNIDFESLNSLFWDQKLIDKHLYKDTDILFQISTKTKMGVFSKGDSKFQKIKLTRFKTILNKNDIYIFPNKIGKFLEILKNYSDHNIYLIDDEIDVLSEAKDINRNIFTILINRKKKHVKNDKIDAQINSLSKIQKFL